MNEFRKASNEFRSQIESEISNIDAEHNKRQILPPSEAPGGTMATLESRPALAGITEPRSSETIVPETGISENSVVGNDTSENRASEPHVATPSSESVHEPPQDLSAESTHNLNSMTKAALPDA